MTRFTFTNTEQVANKLNKNNDNHKNRMSNDSTTSYSLESNASTLSDDDCNVFGDYFGYSERRTLFDSPTKVKKARRVTFAPTTRVISIPPRGHYKDLLSVLYYTKDEYNIFASEAAHEIRAFSDSPECRRKYRQLLTLGMLTRDETMTPLTYTESHSTPSSHDKTNSESDSPLSSPTSYASSLITAFTALTVNHREAEAEKLPEFCPLSKAISILYQPWPVFDDHYMLTHAYTVYISTSTTTYAIVY